MDVLNWTGISDKGGKQIEGTEEISCPICNVPIMHIENGFNRDHVCEHLVIAATDYNGGDPVFFTTLDGKKLWARSVFAVAIMNGDREDWEEDEKVYLENDVYEGDVIDNLARIATEHPRLIAFKVINDGGGGCSGPSGGVINDLFIFKNGDKNLTFSA